MGRRGDAHRRQLRQRDLAVKIGLKDTPAEISRFETGEYYVPWYFYKKLADALGLPFQEFLDQARKDDPESVKFIEKFLSDFPHLDLGKGRGNKVMRISPDLMKRLENFSQNNTASGDTEAVAKVALTEYLKQASEHGIDGHYRPLSPTGNSRKTPTRKPKKASNN